MLLELHVRVFLLWQQVRVYHVFGWKKGAGEIEGVLGVPCLRDESALYEMYLLTNMNSSVLSRTSTCLTVFFFFFPR